MQINRTSPNFTGLIYIKDHPTRCSMTGQAINTKDILFMKGLPDKPHTFIRTESGHELFFYAPYDKVIEAYKKACTSDAEVVEIKREDI